MGRAKKKRVAKRRKRMFNRNSIRAKMGKPVFFTFPIFCDGAAVIPVSVGTLYPNKISLVFLI